MCFCSAVQASPLVQPSSVSDPPATPAIPPTAAIGTCTASGNCGDSVQYTCNTATRQRLCSCDAATGADTCVSLGTCQPTPCGLCSSCVAKVLNFTQRWKDSNNTTTVADAWSDYCAFIQPANASACSTIRQNILSNINVAKKAGLLCKQLGSCPVVDKACPISTTLLSGLPVKAVLNLCAVEGVDSGSLPPGTSASNTPLPGRCLLTGNSSSSSICGAGWQCSNTTTNAVTTCSAVDGSDAVTVQGTCQKTPCQSCQDCLQAAQGFAFSQITSIGSAALSAWSKWCNTTSSVFTASQCSTVAAAIQKTPAAAKRAAAICSQAGICGDLFGACNVTVSAKGSSYTIDATKLNMCTGELQLWNVRLSIAA